MADPIDHNQAEPIEISSALDVEQLDLNLYRSRNLYLPFQARGVFGGQVISQALVAATKCVKPEFALHSLHAYFLLSASASAPLLYYVDRLRDGRSYSTRSVRAVQGGRNVFVMLCSFQIPEVWQSTRYWPMPQAPRPEECENESDYLKNMAGQPNLTEEGRARIIAYAKAREETPISIKYAGTFTNESEGRKMFMYWMKAKTARQYPAAFQKCILAYITDLPLLGVAANISGLKRSAGEESKALGMASSLDHSLMFYKYGIALCHAVCLIVQTFVSNDFDCGDWVLYLMTSPAAALGRTICSGILYSQDGALLAVVNQEGLLRAKVRSPKEETPQAKTKM
ncbi:thioesterase-like superfamily-domain-containing protein [Multifurca ochricompacta]|uniref:Thioesterase-like superfamily-domain-containing protein n=1 Tax=Multifurca ochricompacta TaxID=376703 RepID=A0AAD4MBW9_9AGAM|nr:thioesterase-like superfamily-domain-containing protein [Multifurca ochricompacta]